MIRSLTAAAAILASATAVLAAVPSYADEASAYYAATPATVSGKPTLITNGTVWKWHDTAYVATKGPQREGIVCEMVAQRAGKLSAFSAAGQAFDAAQLAKCNARVK